ncbi:hypothetical protein PybrP1_002733 [[Pythium] brassicae (nom. inval.)]|nr:hypothetical protein PybrP1_002733 [[Pythium] brassicae (nom. inval.)]
MGGAVVESGGTAKSVPRGRTAPRYGASRPYAPAVWTSGVVPIAAPPRFLACTHAFAVRIAYTKFHEEHPEGRALPSRVAETTLKYLEVTEPGTPEHARAVD